LWIQAEKHNPSKGTTWLQLAKKMEDDDTEHHAAKIKERADEKADANRLDEPRQGTERVAGWDWLCYLGREEEGGEEEEEEREREEEREEERAGREDEGAAAGRIGFRGVRV
jgi:hypothetical protein